MSGGASADNVTYRVEWYTGTHEFKEPTYRITRRWIGRWPFRELEYTAECVETGVRMMMSREAFESFAEHYRKQIVSTEL